MRSLLISMAFMFWSMPAVAEVDEYTTQYLLKACETEDANIDKGFCYGALAAAHQFSTVQCYGREHVDFDLPLASEIPEGVTLGAMLQIFVNWARDNPERWGDAFTMSIVTAFAESYPCTRS